MEISSLERFKRCVVVALGNLGQCSLCSAGLTVGLEDFKGLFQPE